MLHSRAELFSRLLEPSEGLVHRQQSPAMVEGLGQRRLLSVGDVLDVDVLESAVVVFKQEAMHPLHQFRRLMLLERLPHQLVHSVRTARCAFANK